MAGGRLKKNSSYLRGIFFGRVRLEGYGVQEKISARKFFRPEKLNFFSFYRTFLNVEAARRIPVKVFIQILTDMDGICV